MKQVLKVFGIILIICAIVMYICAGKIADSAKGSKVTSGYYRDGKFITTDQFTIGGNKEVVEEMGWAKKIAILSGVIGIGSLVGSTIIKED